MVEAIAEVTLRTDEGGGVVRDGGNNGDTVVPALNIFLFILSLNSSHWSPALFRKWMIARLSYLPDRVPPRPMANGRKAVHQLAQRISAPWKLGKKRVSQSSRQMGRNITVNGEMIHGETHGESHLPRGGVKGEKEIARIERDACNF